MNRKIILSAITSLILSACANASATVPPTIPAQAIPQTPTTSSPATAAPSLPPPTKAPTAAPKSSPNCIGQGPITFTAPPMKIEDLQNVLPMGLMTGGHVTPIDHMYFTPKGMKPADRDKYDVYAMANGFITLIQHRSTSVEAGKPSDEYRLYMEHTCTFTSYYDLVTAIDKSIRDQISGDITAPNANLSMRVPIKAGQLLGKIGGQTLDLGVVNLETKLNFIVPEHYARESWKINTVDPFDYMDATFKSQLLALNPRKVTPYGGKIDYDVDGKLIGNWFKEGTNGYGGSDPREYWSGHLAVVPHALDPKLIIISIGSFNGKSQQFGVKGNAPDPATVDSSSGVVKYELVMESITGDGKIVNRPDSAVVQGVVLFQVLANRKLKVEIFPGKNGEQVREFASAALIYER